MATLPPINHPKLPEYGIQTKENTEDLVQQSAGTPRRLAPIAISNKKVCSKQEREMILKLQMLRDQQPLLTKPETSAYRNAYIHTLYLDMLQDGYHKSFSELFALTKQQQEERLSAGPDSVLWNQTLLENEPDKLYVLKVNLTKAEAAGREENFTDVYESEFTLARYFLSTGDKWLSDHFFLSCLHSCLAAPSEKRKLAEAHCNMGLSVEEAGDKFQAADHFESFHMLANENQDWETDEGVTLHNHACIHLTRIYTSIAESAEKDNLLIFVEYLLKAHESAKEGGNKQQEGEASYRLGLGYEKNKEYEKALHFLKIYYEVCLSLEDNHGLGLACEAIARSYERQGKVEECIQHLQMFVEVAEKSELDRDVSRACSDLGAVFNSLSRYEEAAEYFTKAYNISRSLNDKEAISSSRVQYGIAIAHKMLANVSVHIEKEIKPCTKRMVEWKNARTDAFDKEILGAESGTSPPVPPSTAPTKSPSATSEKTNADSGQPTPSPTSKSPSDPTDTQEPVTSEQQKPVTSEQKEPETSES